MGFRQYFQGFHEIMPLVFRNLRTVIPVNVENRTQIPP
jgi:hypothetical protein